VCFRRLRGGVASFYGVRCGEDGDGAVLQKLRFVSGVVVFVCAAQVRATVQAKVARGGCCCSGFAPAFSVAAA